MRYSLDADIIIKLQKSGQLSALKAVGRIPIVVTDVVWEEVVPISPSQHPQAENQESRAPNKSRKQDGPPEGAYRMSLAFYTPTSLAASITALLLTLTAPFAASAQLSNWTAHAGMWKLDSMGDIHQNAQDPADWLGFTGTPANILQRYRFIQDDFSITASMGTKAGSNSGWNAVGFAFRIQDPQNFYRVHFFPGYPGGALRFEKYVNGRAVFIQADTNVGYTPRQGVFYRLRLDVSGATFTARLSDPGGIYPDFTLTYTDTTFASGGVGLSNDSGPGFFRNVYLEQIACGL